MNGNEMRRARARSLGTVFFLVAGKIFGLTVVNYFVDSSLLLGITGCLLVVLVVVLLLLLGNGTYVDEDGNVC